MEELFAVIDQKLNGLPDSIADEQAAVDTMLIATQRLNALAKALIDKYECYSDNRVKYLKILPTAATVFRQAAQTYKEYAEEEPYASIAEDYRVLASAWETIAKVYDKRAKDIGNETDLSETMQFVKRSSVFLSRLETHLLVYPKDAAGPELEAFHKQLRTYIEGFEQLRVRIRTLDQQFQKNLSPDNATEHKPLESLTLYVGDIKVVCPSTDAAKIVKAGLAKKNIAYDIQPFSSNSFFNLIEDEREAIRPAAYEPQKMSTVPNLVDRINSLPPPIRNRNMPSTSQPKSIPSRDRTARRAPPARYYAPPPVIFVPREAFVGPDGIPIEPPSVIEVSFPRAVAHR
jgi:hypothetical protein